MKVEVFFYIYFILAFVILRIPFVGKVLKVYNTLIHESAHAFMSLVFKGEIDKIDLFYDASGVTVTKNNGKLSSFFVSIAGYIAPPIIVLGMLLLIKYGYYLSMLYFIFSLIVINLILFVRNIYGLLWLIANAILVFLCIKSQNQMLSFHVTITLSCLILAESILSIIVLLRISLKSPNKAGDASNLQKLIGIPATIWSLLFLATSAFVVFYIITKIFPLKILIEHYLPF